MNLPDNENVRLLRSQDSSLVKAVKLASSSFKEVKGKAISKKESSETFTSDLPPIVYAGRKLVPTLILESKSGMSVMSFEYNHNLKEVKTAKSIYDALLAEAKLALPYSWENEGDEILDKSAGGEFYWRSTLRMKVGLVAVVGFYNSKSGELSVSSDVCSDALMAFWRIIASATTQKEYLCVDDGASKDCSKDYT